MNNRCPLATLQSVVGIGYSNRVTLSQVIEEATMPGDAGGYKEFDVKWPDLHAAVMRVASIYNRPPDPRRFGDFMRTVKGRVVDTLRFCYKPNPKGQSQWWVERRGNADEQVPGLRSQPNVVKPSFGDRN